MIPAPRPTRDEPVAQCGLHSCVMEHRFLCDAMLGTLARWLRFAGYDTLFDPRCSDSELADLARIEGRWLLTADRELASRAGPRVLLVVEGGLREQVGQVLARLGLRPDPAAFFRRCSRCNSLIDQVSRDAVRGVVPPFVAARADRFSRCLGCGRVYWPGTHQRRILERLTQLFSAN